MAIKFMKGLEHQVFDLLMEAPVPFSIYKGETHIVEFANKTALQIAGKTSDIIGRPVIEILPEVEGQGYIQLLDRVRETGETYRAMEAPITLYINGETKEMFINFTYQPIMDETGAVERIMAIATDVTEQVLARKKIEKSQQQFRNVLEQAPSPILILKGDELVLEAANEPLFKLWNVGSEAIGKPFLSILPEMKEQGFHDLLLNVYHKGEPYFGFEQPVYFMRPEGLKMHYFNFEYQPYKEMDGSITGVLILATDITDQMVARQKAEESEQHFKTLVMQAPVGICILQGEDFVVELVNDTYLEIVHRKRELFEGKPLWEGIPEVKDQGFDKMLKDVLNKECGFTGREFEVSLIRNGIQEHIYIDFVYEPLKEIGKRGVGRILVLAIDVTEKVKARKKIEEAEERSRLAIEAAELGTFEVDLHTNHLVGSNRLNEIFDVGNDSDRNRYISAIHPEDLTIRKDAYEVAFQTGSLEYECRLFHKNQSVHWIKVKGKLVRDEVGEPARVLGVVQDITEQKLFAEELKRQVREQTNELSKANLELKKINRELEQFAYVSSHDLQEPLRKIKIFSAMIMERDGEVLSEYSKSKFTKVTDASERMSKSLRDLLNYASTGKEAPLEKVDLNNVINGVNGDLELLISQKKAILKTDTLPVISAIPLQMHQLFYNLINNALKFSRKDVVPIIEINCDKVTKETGHETKNFYQITVRDNGIGFEKSGEEKIFGIFQRMHDRHSYDGTGIGLALCKKVVENHGGDIWATSAVNEGSSFTVLLPA